MTDHSSGCSNSQPTEQEGAAVEHIWQCKIGGECPQLPRGSDAPMRAAVREEFRALTGRDPAFIFSGWAAELSESERAVVDNRLPSREAVLAAELRNVLPILGDGQWISADRREDVRDLAERISALLTTTDDSRDALQTASQSNEQSPDEAREAALEEALKRCQEIHADYQLARERGSLLSRDTLIYADRQRGISDCIEAIRALKSQEKP